MRFKGLCFITLTLHAQIHYHDTLVTLQSPIQLHNNLLVPTLEIYSLPDSQKLSLEHFTINPISGILILKDTTKYTTNVYIRYAYFQDTSFYHYRQHTPPSPQQWDSLLQATDTFSYNVSTSPYEFRYSGATLEKRGNLSRSITIGTNRDLAVNSDFRLELSGYLGDSIEVLGSITDANIPIQPDGTTQSLQEFDRVFIQLRKAPYQVILGDYEVQHQGSRFVNFYRNVLGIQGAYETPKQELKVSYSVAKGKFHVNRFMGINGHQGPYQLRGRNGERLITVLAGSEKVYLNGKLLQRGSDKDYVIDYNTGQIFFTAKHLITNNTRIVVDFEYIDRNYTRTLQVMQYRRRLWRDRVLFQVLYARDADNPNAPLDFRLGDKERAIMAEAGDDPLKAVVSGIDTLQPGDTAIVRYAIKDTILYGYYFPVVLYYSQDTTIAKYTAIFSYVGQGKGHYIKSTRSILNANVFEWVGIDSSGKPLGSYEPIRILPLPKQVQVIATQTQIQLHPKITLYNETNISIVDNNRLSSKDDADNVDIAQYSRLQITQLPLIERFLAIDAHLYGQYVGSRFQSIDRVYQKEYYREWNFNDQIRDIERVFGGGVRWWFFKRYALYVEQALRLMGDSLKTDRKVFAFQGNDSALVRGELTSKRLFTITKNQWNSLWWQHLGKIYIPFLKYWQSGIQIWIEDKQDKQNDSLTNGFRFYDLTPYLQWQRKAWLIKLSYNFREDYAFKQRRMRYKSISHLPQWEGQYQWKSGLVQMQTSYRFFELKDSVFWSDTLQNERRWMNHFVWQQRLRTLQWRFQHTLNSRRIPKQEVVFVKVNPGMGQYEWIDYNNNGLQELDEFQISINPLTAEYVRVLLPSAQFVEVIGNQFLIHLRWHPKRTRKKWWSQIRYQLQFQFNEENQRQGTAFSDYLPQWSTLKDTTLVNARRSLQQQLHLFPQKKHSFRIFSIWQQQLQSWTITKDQLQRQRYQITYKNRWNQQTNFLLTLLYEGRERRNEKLLQQNYALRSISVEPSIERFFKQQLRIRLGWVFSYKEDRQEALALARLYKLKGSIHWQFRTHSRINCTLEAFYAAFQGTTTAGGQYQLLEGMSPGRNLKADFIYTQRLFKSIEMDTFFSARISEATFPILSLRVQVRALF